MDVQECGGMVSGVEMSNLKQLVVSIGKGYGDGDSLIPVISFIRVSPGLQRLVVEVINHLIN